MQTFMHGQRHLESLEKTARHIINRIEYYRLEYGNHDVTLSNIYESLNEVFGRVVVIHSEKIRKKIIEFLFHIREGFYTLKDVVYRLLRYILRLQQMTHCGNDGLIGGC